MRIIVSKLPSKLTFVNVIIITAAIIAAIPCMTIAQINEDSAAVQSVLEAYQSVWNTHKSTALAEFFTKDADMIIGNLPAKHGRQAIQQGWQNYFAKQEPGRRLTIAVNSVRSLSSDAVLANITTTTGGKDTLDEELPKRKARGTWLLHKQQGNWFVMAMQAMPGEKDSVILKASPEIVKVLMPEIRVFVEAYEDAFNTHDPDAVSALFSNDADIIVRNYPLIQGSREIKEWWRDYFSRSRPYRALFIIDGIRMIDSDVALLNIVATGKPQNAEAEQQSLRYARGRWILVKEDGDWLIAALRILPGMDDLILRKIYH